MEAPAAAARRATSAAAATATLATTTVTNSRHAGTHKSKKFAVNSRINLLTFGSSVAKRKKNKSTKFQHVARGGARVYEGRGS